MDAGSAADGVVQHICREADAVVDGDHGQRSVGGWHIRRHQSAVGIFGPGSVQPRLHLLVNMAPTARVAEVVYYRLARTCRRVLGIELQSAGELATARRTWVNSRGDTIGLNLQGDLADTMRGVSAAEALAS